MDQTTSKCLQVLDGRREAEKVSVKRLQEVSKARLATILKKKLTTSFIGALDRFERFFGNLWGHNLPANQRTREQQDWEELWQNCRNEILNNGNNQIRAVESELELYSITWERYNTVFTGGTKKNG